MLILLANTFTNADVILDHFEDVHGDDPEQCHLGAAYGFTEFGDSVHMGNGWWYTFTDTMGTIVTNKDKDTIVDDNISSIVDNGVLHLCFRTDLSSAPMNDSGGYAYAGVDCELMGDSLDYWDFSNLEKITMRIKGSGIVRILLHTKDIDTLKDSTGHPIEWGYYGFTYKLNENWVDLKIPADSANCFLDPEVDSPPAKLGWNWHHGKEAVSIFTIEADPNKKDSIEFWVDDIVFVGLDYNDPFGFDYINAIKYQFIGSPKSLNNLNVSSNLFNKTVNISYKLEQNGDVKVDIFDITGKTVTRLIDMKQKSGQHSVIADFGSNPRPSGVYFVRLNIDGIVAVSRKFNFIK